MKKEDFLLAIELCTYYHSTLIEINPTEPGGVVKLENNIRIKNAVPALTSSLMEAGFSLGVTPEGVSVHKF